MKTMFGNYKNYVLLHKNLAKIFKGTCKGAYLLVKTLRSNLKIEFILHVFFKDFAKI